MTSPMTDAKVELVAKLRDTRRRTPFEPWARKVMLEAADALEQSDAVMEQSVGVPPSPSGHSAKPESVFPVSAASAASVPNADGPSATEAVDAERARIIRCAHEAGDFVVGDDGFFVYWPTPLTGALNEWVLRLLAEELERLNAPWVEKMTEYFASAIETEGGNEVPSRSDESAVVAPSDETPEPSSIAPVQDDDAELADDLRYIAAHTNDPRNEEIIYKAADCIDRLSRQAGG